MLTVKLLLLEKLALKNLNKNGVKHSIKKLTKQLILKCFSPGPTEFWQE